MQQFTKKYYIKIHGTGITDIGTDSDSDTNSGRDADVEQATAVEAMADTSKQHSSSS